MSDGTDVPSTWPLFVELTGEGRLALDRDALVVLLDATSPTTVAPGVADRLRGMLWGLAIGDALGNTTEGVNPGARRRRYGRIESYRPNHHAGGAPVGLPSDDTQLAAWTLEHLLEHGTLVPDQLSWTFATRQIFGIGQATRAFQAHRRAGASWTSAGQPSAGNGALMRIAAAVVPHLQSDGPDLWADAALNAFLTHNDRLAIASAVAWCDLLKRLLAGEIPDGPEWWLDAYLRLGRSLEGRTRYHTRVTAGPLQGWTGAVWQLVDAEVRAAVRGGLSVFEAQDQWHSGAYLLETIPSALMILARHGDDPRAAILAAVNDTRDNDTIAAIVGAAVGARHGLHALPMEWRDGLLGRTGADDDGRYQRLVEEVVGRWGMGTGS